MTIDYSDFEDKTVGDNALAQITATAEHQLELEADIASLEEQLKIKKGELAIVSEKTLPELMDAVGMDEFKLKNGRKVIVNTDIRASIPKDRAAAGIAWLRKNGFGALIKNQVIAEFSVGEDEKAQAALNLLRAKAGTNLIAQKEAVNHMTLSAWVREKFENDPNADLPVDLLGIFRQRKSVIK